MAKSAGGFTEKSFTFFKQLEKNNNKEWFHANKATYENCIRDPFIEVLEEISDLLAMSPIPLSGGKQTTFRINRDIRFSKDKSPYKTSMAGMLTRSGTRRESGGVAYLGFGADGGQMGAGYYQLSPKDLEPIRQRILEEADDFRALLEALSASGLEVSHENRLSSMPRGFTAHAEHEHAEYLKLKSFIIMAPLVKKAWKDGTVVVDVAEFVQSAQPLLDFVDAAQ